MNPRICVNPPRPVSCPLRCTVFQAPALPCQGRIGTARVRLSPGGAWTACEGATQAIEAFLKAGRETQDETQGSQESLQMELEKRLYVRTGFPQLVQGKRGENWGESRMPCNILVSGGLEDLNLASCSTRRVV